MGTRVQDGKDVNVNMKKKKREVREKKERVRDENKDYNNMIYGVGAKVVAMILMAISLFIAVISVWGGCLLIEYDAYTTSKEHFVEQFYENAAWSEAYTVLNKYYLNTYVDMEMDIEADIEEYVSEGNYAGTIEQDGVTICSFGDLEKTFSEVYDCNFALEYYLEYVEEEHEGEIATVYIYIYEEMTEVDEFSFINQAMSLAYGLRYGVWIISLLAACIAIGLFVFLLSVAGHTRNTEEVIPWGVDCIPTDVYTGMMLLGMVVVLWFITSIASARFSNLIVAIIMAIGSVMEVIMGTLYCMSIAVRVKARSVFRNTLIYKVFICLGKCLKNVWKVMGLLTENLPLILKAMPIYIFCSLLGFYGIFVWYGGVRFLLWIIVNIIAFVTVLYVCMVVGQLRKASKKMAEGDLESQVQTKYMVFDFATIGNNMNDIASGMSIAVEERMKSERFKTELITNVGHDIKTPLTSIINYTGLIQKEEIENEHIKEYTAILKRQSERLKRLIEDLVEASKASTGNVDVQLAPCDVGVLLTQAIGEYELKLQGAQLTLVTKQPQEPVSIMADGRLLWRVFDNCLNNICKYAQEGTRVYIDIIKHKDEVRIEFKNISRYELNISEDELMERFVRGDKSRHSEGNGLGLSIAKSLMEVQGGEMTLAIDGDLFKAILIF